MGKNHFGYHYGIECPECDEMLINSDGEDSTDRPYPVVNIKKHELDTFDCKNCNKSFEISLSVVEINAR